MKQYGKRVISLTLVTIMCLSLFCSPVWAAAANLPEGAANASEIVEPQSEDALPTEPDEAAAQEISAEELKETAPVNEELQESSPNAAAAEADESRALQVITADTSMDYYRGISEMVKASSGLVSSSERGEFEDARLLVNGARGLDFSSYEGALRIIDDADGNYAIQFASSQQAEAAYNRLNTLASVDWVEPDGKVTLFENAEAVVENQDDEMGARLASEHKSWGISNIGSDEYASRFATSGIATVAVVDTGVDASHTYLENRVLSGYDFVDNDADPSDGHYHGTHVAGTIVDVTLNMPDNVKILPVRVLNARGSGSSSVVAAGIRYAADNGADVINLSLGGGHSNSVDEAVRYASEKGSLCVAAAGNDDEDAGSSCPAHVSEALTVGAVDSNEEKAYFSNYGSVVELCAPGVDILSCTPNGGWRTLSGTSMAAPHVSGCAALVKLKNSEFTSSQLKQAMTDSCRESNWNGYGIIDLRGSIEDENPATITLSKDEVNLQVNGDNSSETVEIAAGGSLPARYNFSYSTNGSGFECSLAGTGSQRSLLITGTQAGRGTVTVSLKNSADNSILASGQISVMVGDVPYPLGGTVTDWRQLESAHDYADDSDYTWIFTDTKASQGMRLTFSEDTQLEDDYDYLYIYSGSATDADDILVGTYTGSQLSGQVVNVPGNTVKIQLVSDSTDSYYGFKVTDYEYTSINYPQGGKVDNWRDLESCHNYKNSESWLWEYTDSGNADSLDVTFSEDTRVEDGWDYIFIYDEDDKQIGDGYSGTELAGRTINVPGNTVKIRLTADGSTNYYGFRVSDLKAVRSGNDNNDELVSDWRNLKSNHPYANDMDHTWIYKFYQDCSSLDVTFSNKTKTENIYDHIYLYTGSDDLIGDYTGSELAGKTIRVEGDTIKIRLTSDSSEQYWGFEVTDVQGVAENTENPYPESQHDYEPESNDIQVWEWKGEKEAKSLDVTFDERTKVESRHDHITVYGVYREGDKEIETKVGEYTGTELAGKTIRVPGRKVKIQLTSDSSYNFWGYKVTQIMPVYTDLTISTGSAEVYSGGTVEIPVTIENNTGIAGFGFEIGYDRSLLTLVSVEAGSLIDGKGSFGTNGNIVTWYNAANISDPSGVLMNLKFRVDSSAAQIRTPVSVSLSNGKGEKSNLSDEDGKPVSAVFQGGMVNILGGLMGDLTGDGELSIGDVVMLNRAVLKLIVLDQRQDRLARVTGNTSVTIADVVRLNRIVLGLYTEAKAGKGNAAEKRARQGEVKISVDSVSASKGDAIKLPVRISGNSGIGGFSLDFEIPDGYELDSESPFTAGDILKNEALGANPEIKKVNWYCASGTTKKGDGILFYINLKAGENAATGNVSIKASEKAVVDENSNPISVTFEKGTVTIDGSSTIPNPEAKDISEASIEPIPDQTYTGKAIKPSVTVKYEGKTLRKGTDYTVSYKDNVKVGLAEVTIRGIGGYKGYKEAAFYIKSSGSDIPSPSPNPGFVKLSNASANGGAVSKVHTTRSGNAGITAVKNTKSVTIPAKVTVDGKKYTVTTINANAFAKAKKATKITISRSSKNLTFKKNAFKGSSKKLKTVVIKITKASQIKAAKGSFKALSKKVVVKVDKNTSAKELKKIMKILKKAGFKGRLTK